MIETFLAYIIIILPSIITILGGIATVIACINKIRKNSAETQAVVAEAKATVEHIKSSPELKDMFAVICAENQSLKRALTEATEALTRQKNRILKQNEDGEGNDKV